MPVTHSDKHKTCFRQDQSTIVSAAAYIITCTPIKPTLQEQNPAQTWSSLQRRKPPPSSVRGAPVVPRRTLQEIKPTLLTCIYHQQTLQQSETHNKLHGWVYFSLAINVQNGSTKKKQDTTNKRLSTIKLYTKWRPDNVSAADGGCVLVTTCMHVN